METLPHMMEHEHEQVVFCYDKTSGLKAIIAIHDTTLGPALGGLRMWPYANESEALFDALRLSKGMTYKNAAAGLNLGGGKAVIMADPSMKSEGLYRAFGRFVEGLGGRYITAEDVNTSTDDIMHIREETHHVAGVDEAVGGGGNPAPLTALGVFVGIKTSVAKRLGVDSLKGITVAVQGVGSVGGRLCHLLHEAGARLIVTDPRPENTEAMVQQCGARAVGLAEIYSVEADVFAPCALGGILNDQTIEQLQCTVVAGAANNQLLDEAPHSQRLKTKNILYAPDYIINAGGVISCYFEVIDEYVKAAVVKKVKNISRTLESVYRLAEQQNIPTPQASARLAEERIAQIGQVQRTYVGRWD